LSGALLHDHKAKAGNKQINRVHNQVLGRSAIQVQKVTGNADR